MPGSTPYLHIFMNTNRFIAINFATQSQMFFSLNGEHTLTENGLPYQNEQFVELKEGKLLFNGDLYDELHFYPLLNDTNSFSLDDLNASVDGYEYQRGSNHSGVLRLKGEQHLLSAVKIQPIEQFLSEKLAIDNYMLTVSHHLKTQAILNRSKRLHPNFDLCTDTLCECCKSIHSSLEKTLAV